MKHRTHQCTPDKDVTKTAIERALRQQFKRYFDVAPLDDRYSVAWEGKPFVTDVEDCLEHAGLRCQVSSFMWNTSLSLNTERNASFIGQELVL